MPNYNQNAHATHFVMPLLTPVLHARVPFIVLMMLLFPTLGNPEEKKKECSHLTLNEQFLSNKS